MSGRRVRTLVLDDDPTGTQSATDVTVLFDHDVDLLAAVLDVEPSVYLQTNSRALDEAAAVALARSIRAAVDGVARRLDADVRVVLRGDSTLRGHVFSESVEFLDDDGVMLFVPAFPDGGRETRDGIHRVRQGGRLVPVAETEYARDTVFPFDTSDLVAFAAGLSGRPTELVDLAGVRGGQLEAALTAASAGSVIVADAVTNADVALVARAVEAAWERRQVVVRSAAPLAAELAGVHSRGLLKGPRLVPGGRVLVVCGSHTEGASEQLAVLVRDIGEPTVLDTERAMVNPQAEGMRVADAEAHVRRAGDVLFIATERHRTSSRASLADGARVMTALAAAAGALAPLADVVVTKGGITSAEIIRSGLGATHARVLGQWRPGVSVWSVRAGDGREIPCVIVPGNMGDADVLRAAVSWVSA